ncbi:MAG: HlyD family type I secretion periplasmic adaptor subunit [Alphaproteobacteria bacterium]|nr:HlyD family type I secretion periplasmic adaptor subunit [Alphaproteobacteria bacterium]
MFSSKIKETDFMSELDAATKMRPATSAILMLFSIMALVLFAIVWAGIAEVSVITRGQGQVVPSADVQVVQSLEGGIVEEMLVVPGQTVEKGEILMRLSDVAFSSEERGTEARFLGLEAKKARLTAEANGEEFTVPERVQQKAPQVAENEKALYDSRQKELQNAYAILDDRIAKAKAELAEVRAQISGFSSSRTLLRQELQITKDLVAKRAVPKLEEIRLNREISELTGQINAQSQRQKALQAELQVTEKERASQLDRFRSQALGELNEVETEISSLRESLVSISDRVERREVRAPVDGVVNNITVRTLGGVVEPAMELFEIVPLDEELKILAQVQPNEIAFIRPGQPAKVKITAYDSQKYGALDGELVRLGATSNRDADGNIFFEIEIHTEKNYLGDADNPLPITPGMVAEVEVITGERTVLEYLLKPVLRARDRAFTEQ